MAILKTLPVKHRYAPPGLLGNYTGWFEASGTSTGDASGGNNNIVVVPTAPQERIYRVDNMFCAWQIIVGSDETVVKMGFSTGEDLAANTIAIIDTSNKAEGDREFNFTEGWLWRSNATGAELCEWLAVNTNTQVLNLRVSGKFYEAPAGR